MYLVRFLTTAGLAALEFKAAIPAGMALGLDPFSTFLAAALGATFDTLVILFLGEKFRRWVLARHGKGRSPGRWLGSAYTRFGAPGLGLLAPLLVGTPLGTALGISLGLEARPLFVWMTAGTAFWSAILTTTVAAGFEGLRFFFHL